MFVKKSSIFPSAVEELRKCSLHLKYTKYSPRVSWGFGGSCPLLSSWRNSKVYELSVASGARPESARAEYVALSSLRLKAQDWCR